MKKIPLLLLLSCFMGKAFAASHNPKNNTPGCSATITISPGNTTICSSASLTLIASGGVSYVWSDGETTSAIAVTPSSTSTYSVTGIDGNGCTGTASVVITVDNIAAGESYAYSQTCDGLPITFSASINGGVPPFNYSWYADGSNGTTDTITNYSTSPNDYSLVITDSVGCTANANSPFIPRQEFYAFMPPLARFCNDYGKNTNTIGLTIVAGKQPFTFHWNTGDSTQNIHLDAPGIYSVVATDANACSQTFSCNVSFIGSPTVTITSSANTIPSGVPDTLTASGAEKYYWSNGKMGSRLIVTPDKSSDYAVYGWDTTTMQIQGVGYIMQGCGSPWQSVPVILSDDIWRPSLTGPFTYTSPIYTLGDVAIGKQIPNYKLDVDGTIATDSALLVGKVSTGHGLSLNGNNATITSPTHTVGFGSDTLTTTGKMKMAALNVSGNDVNMQGIVTDTITDLMGVDRHGHVAPVTMSNLVNIIWPCWPLPCEDYLPCYGVNTPVLPFIYNPVSGAPGIWEIFPCVNTGFGFKNPDAVVSINTTQSFNLNPFSIATSSISGFGTDGGTPTDIFYVSKTGFTSVGMNACQHADAVLCISAASPNNQEFSVQNPVYNNDVFTIDQNGNTYAAGNVGVGTSNNAVFVGGGGSIASGGYTTPGFNPIQSYLGFNLYSNGSGIWQQANNAGSAAILTDNQGYMNFISIFNTTNGVTDAIMQQFAQMVVSPYGVLIRNTFSTNGGATPMCKLDPSLALNPSGSVPGQYVFAVGGSMIAQELLIQPCSGTWCDYVFDKGYKITPLKDLEKYILENKHLPDVPSAKEVKDDGIKVGDMDATMLKKIEELTLYIIKQQKQIDEMNEEINKIKANK